MSARRGSGTERTGAPRAFFYGVSTIAHDLPLSPEARDLVGGVGLITVVGIGLVSVFPGLVVAGIGGLLARRPCCHREGVTLARRAEQEGRII